MAELKDRANSMETHRTIYAGILRANKPTNIDRAVDRKKVPLGGDDSLNIVEAIFNSGGCDVAFIESDDIAER
jgi:hypothetical protein